MLFWQLATGLRLTKARMRIRSRWAVVTVAVLLRLRAAHALKYLGII